MRAQTAYMQRSHRLGVQDDELIKANLTTVPSAISSAHACVLCGRGGSDPHVPS